MRKITAEDLEMLQERINDPDWDISQQNDVWELLPQLLEAAKLSDVIMCAYCGRWCTTWPNISGRTADRFG